MKSNAELTKRQLQVLPYLLSCSTYEEAARQAHVSVKQNINVREVFAELIHRTQ